MDTSDAILSSTTTIGSVHTASPTPLSIKQRKENFVSGLTGGSVSEIYICTLIAISSYLAWAVIQSRLGFFPVSNTSSSSSSSSSSSKTSKLSHQSIQKIIALLLSIPTLVDVTLNWLTSLLSITTYSGHPLLLNAAVLIPTLYILATRPRKSLAQLEQISNPSINKINTSKDSKDTNKKDHQQQQQQQQQQQPTNTPSLLKTYLPHHSFLSVYRGQMMILTCLAIIAVDFPIFPRRFAKVETWGTSLMDLGVGSFVFSMGLVSSRATLSSTFTNSVAPFFSTLIKTLRGVLTVLLLGLMRLYFVKSLDYQEHVTEYGIHWNFFMTLGFLPLFVTIIDSIAPPRKQSKDGTPIKSFTIPTVFLALIIAIVYEYALDKLGLVAWIITAPRVNLLSQNKEGVCSFIGYFSIFLFGKATGYYTLPSTVSYKALLYPQTRSEFLASKSTPAQGNPKTAARVRRLYMLLISSFAFHIAYFTARKLLRLQVSRRFANLPYVLWIGAYNTLNLAFFAAVELAVFGNPDAYPYEMLVPASVDSVNSSGLFIFLLANVSTGLINMSLNTLDASPQVALAVLSLYALFLYTVGTVLKQLGIVIRL
ncbi:uncharacterized protein SAPINGB_P004533 [Magnusiomyces paraingens]|uniref:GPI-anchored wall transfer protein n=1 Tax=Magnusiomyces paraingens TaxID=2606893 RepID=A0A5E8BW36_9ASCO|nr:uncharacterized protein SAPINGB_P004533 [Saprochaete ingens]VVT55311.1 unnamed protein product [Saprochaete ingens]